MATQQMLDELKAAYYSGAQNISYEGKQISYRDGAEMRAAISSLERELGITQPTRVVVYADKGW
jgi:hypothetical protein